VTHNKGPIIRIAFANTSASRNTAGGHLRASFSELKESDIEDPLQRTWKQVCQSVLNENVDFHGWQSTEAECIQLLEEKKK